MRSDKDTTHTKSLKQIYVGLQYADRKRERVAQKTRRMQREGLMLWTVA